MNSRLISALLALILSAGLLASCGGDTAGDETGTTATPGTETTTVEETTTEDPRLIDELPTDKKFDGKDYVVMSNDYGAGSVAWMVVDIYTEEETGERINDAVYARNLEMNERFGVSVKQQLVSSPSTEMTTRITAGEDTVDVLMTTMTTQASLVMQGYAYEMSALPYLNFDKAWWDTTAIRGLSIGDHVYTAFGSAQLNSMKASLATFFNKKLAKDAGLPDLYQVVRDGKWTLDTMMEYGQKMVKDLNGDGVIKWKEDVFGISVSHAIPVPLLLGTGERITTFSDDGTYEWGLESQRMVDAAEKIWKFMFTDPDLVCNVQLQSDSSIWVTTRALFASDQFGFMLQHMSTPTLIAGDMQSDFGILPFPKVFEDQEDYISTILCTSGHSIIIPKSVQKVDDTALLTEGYQMMAHDTVREAYYDYTLTLRATRDTESAEMLDIIFNNRNLDLSMLYTSTTTVESTLYSIFQNEGAFTYASTIAGKRDSIKTALDEVVQTILGKE